MGQHKHNPVAIAAAHGKLPPKKRGLSKRERDSRIHAFVRRRLAEMALRGIQAKMEEEATR